MIPRLALLLPLLLGPFAVACAAAPVQPAAVPPAAAQAPMRIVMESRPGSGDTPVIVRSDGAIERDRALGKVSADRVVNVMGQVVMQLMPDGTLQSPGEQLSSRITPEGELEGRGIKTSISGDSRIVVATRYGSNVVGKVEGFRPEKRKTVLLVIAALPKLTKAAR